MAERDRAGLFVDLDGTLADSLSVLRTVYGDFLAQFGVSDSDAEFERLNGPPLADVVATLRDAHALPGTVEDLHALYLSLVAEAHRVAPPRAGARRLLETARAQAMPVAVVTSGTRDLATAWLVHHGLDSLVSVLVGSDDVRHPKPHPDPYRIALLRTACAPGASLAVEDSRLGATAAIGAGLPTVVLGRTVDPAVQASPLFRGCVATLEALTERLAVRSPEGGARTSGGRGPAAQARESGC